jgi:hypothetical protein
MWVHPLVLVVLVFLLLVFMKLSFDYIDKEQRLSAKLAAVAAELDQARASALDGLRSQWFQGIPGVTFNNEVEVEVKLIAPLVRFLGYREADYRLRVPIRLQAGRQEVVVEADWVLYREERPFVVVEAKAPGEALTDQVLGQARSYAFGLGAPYYMVTNGLQLSLYELGVPGDRLLLGVDLSSLPTAWPDLLSTIGRDRSTDQGT